MKKKSIMMVLVMVLMMVIIISCASNEDDSRVKESLIEAGEVLGIEIPWPHYLPEGYEIKNVILKSNDTASLMISNGKDKLIELNILWRPEGIIPYRIDLNAPTVEFNGITGQLIESGDTKIGVVWNWYPERYQPGLIILELFAPKDLPVEELVLIAGSVGW